MLDGFRVVLGGDVRRRAQHGRRQLIAHEAEVGGVVIDAKPVHQERFGVIGPGMKEVGVGRVGFIASVSRPFCLNCNRIRLTADGKFRYCLFAIEETDIRTLLRNGGPDEAIADAVRGSVKAKWLGHQINSTQFVPPPRPMYSIGG